MNKKIKRGFPVLQAGVTHLITGLDLQSMVAMVQNTGHIYSICFTSALVVEYECGCNHPDHQSCNKLPIRLLL